MSFGVCGVIIQKEGKKHHLGVGNACFFWGGDGQGLQFGAAGFGILRLEVTDSTQPTTQERKQTGPNSGITIARITIVGRTKSEFRTAISGHFRAFSYIDAERHQIDQVHARSLIAVALSLSSPYPTVR